MDFYKENGYIILENIFSIDEILDFRNQIIHFLQTREKIINCEKGISIPNFISYPELSTVSKIKDNKLIHNELEKLFQGNNYRFCQHNDIGINRIVGWHKDKLNGEYSKYENLNIWNEFNGERFEIVKVLIYLQDHSCDDFGLKIVPKSQRNENIETNHLIQLHPKIGDVIIFDQRITHRGMDQHMNEKRILVSFGFGRNNIFTDNFERGTIQRQNDQNNKLLIM